MKVSKKEFAKQLKALGLKKNDIVLLHSSLSSIGEMEDGAEGVIDAFMDVLGKGGTLAVPVFGKLGIITDCLKARKGAVISTAPVGTLAAIGGKAKELMDGHWEADTAHGEGTPFDKIAQAGGYVCLLGVDQDRNTMLHSAEAMLELPYLGQTTRTAIAPNGKETTKTWKFYPGPHRNFIGLDKVFLDAGAMQIGRIGNAQVRLLKAQLMMDVALATGDADPAFVLCDNPACQDCVRQRAAIYRARMQEEEFTLAASARLAGRYVPEMIENLHACGIDQVELDYVQGIAAPQLPVEKLQAAVKEFTDAKITVTAMRSPVAPDNWEGVLMKCQLAGISVLVVPLTGFVPDAKLLKKYGVQLRFANHAQTAPQAAQAFAALPKSLNAEFVFSPVESAKAGEHPFLTSWNTGKFIRVIRQLDVADALYDGTAVPLANGNAEIKELISILRCHNFNGLLVLGGGNGLPGTLQENAADFRNLMENL